MKRILCLVLASACASAPVNPGPKYKVETSSETPPPLTVQAEAAGQLDPATGSASAPPRLSTGQPAVSRPSLRPVSVQASNDDLTATLHRIAAEAGMDIFIDPEVKGTVTTNIVSLPADEAIRSILTGRFPFTIQGNTLIVTRDALVTETYEVPYSQATRASTSTTSINRGLGGGSSIRTGSPGTAGGLSSASGASGLSGGGGDVIQQSSNADPWGEIRIALEGLLFSGVSDSSGQRTPTQPQGGAQLGASATNNCAPDGTCMVVMPFAGLVAVTASPAKHEMVKALLNAHKSAVTRQVMIQAKIVEVSFDRTTRTGIDWSALATTARGTVGAGTSGATEGSTGTVQLTYRTGSIEWNVIVDALRTYGDVNVLQQPQTWAMHNQKATFNVTRDEPVFALLRTPIISPTTGATIGFNETPEAQIIQVGVVLDVLPTISSTNLVLMSIRPSITSISSTKTFTSANGTRAELPVVERRESDTMVQLRAGETVVIGGLMQTSTDTQRRGIPGLMDIPGLGRLFSHTATVTRRAELVIFLTPIIQSGQPTGGSR